MHNYLTMSRIGKILRGLSH